MSLQISIMGPAFLVFCLLFGYVSLQSAPALVWSNEEGRSPYSTLRFNTLVDQIEPADLLSEYTKSKVPIVAFVQKDLSVEQFTANDAPFVSSIFDNVNANPVMFTDVKTPQKIYSSFKTDTQANENTVVYLPGKNLKENDDFIKSYSEKMNASGPVTFILTGENNELSSQNKAFIEGHKRATRETKKEGEPDPGTFITFPTENPCVLYYSRKATLVLRKDKGEEAKTILLEQPTANAATSAEVCSVKGTPTVGTTSYGKELSLKFSNTSENVNLILNFQFPGFNESTSWTATKIDAEITPTYGTYNLANSLEYIPWIFSYSCQNTIFFLNGTGDYPTGTLTIEAFQLQPFYTKTKDETAGTAPSYAFVSSSDCTVWFTLPIWAGLIVSLILIAILYFGVVALMSIITPDRFENPKGRGLIITNVEE